MTGRKKIRNSRSGISDPGRQEIDRHDHGRLGPIAEIPDLLERTVDLAGDLGDECVTLTEEIPRRVDQLVRVRGMRQVVVREDERLRETSELLLVRLGVLLDLLQDLPVRVGSGDVVLDLGRVELPLVLQKVELLLARCRVDRLDLLSLLEEDTLHPDVGSDAHGVVVDQVTLLDRALVVVSVGDVLEVGHRVGRGRRGEADLDAVEVVKRPTPGGELLRRVPPVALVGDDEIEGVDRDVELLGVLVDGLIADREGGIASVQVDGHPLDRGDVHERLAALRVRQVPGRDDLRVEGPIVVEVVPEEPLAVHLVDLVELQPGLRFERGESPDGLGGQRPAIDEEQHAASNARLHQAVDLVYQRDGLAGAGGDGDEHLPLAVPDRSLDRLVRLVLVGTEVRVRRESRQRAQLRRAVTVQQLAEGGRRVEGGHPAGAVQRVTDVVEPDDLAVGGVKERDPEPLPVVDRVGHETAGVALRLRQHALGTEGDLLGLHHAERLVAIPQGVVSWPGRCLELGHRRLVPVVGQGLGGDEWHDAPARRFELRVDPLTPGLALKLGTHLAVCPFSVPIGDRRSLLQGSIPAKDRGRTYQGRRTLQRSMSRMLTRTCSLIEIDGTGR